MKYTEVAMKKTTITITFDEDKLAAAKLYMEQKELEFDDEMVKAAEALYQKYVPTNVREFIDMSAGTKSSPSQRRKPKIILPDTESEVVTAGEDE